MITLSVLLDGNAAEDICNLFTRIGRVLEHVDDFFRAAFSTELFRCAHKRRPRSIHQHGFLEFRRLKRPGPRARPDDDEVTCGLA